MAHAGIGFSRWCENFN